MERTERVSRAMRTVLMVAAPFLWPLSIVLGLLDVDGGVPGILMGAALAGTLCGQIRERDDRTIATLGRELADATRPGHHDHRHLRGVPGRQ